MINRCPICSAYRVDKQIDPEGPFAICPVCGFRQVFRLLPLLTVTGASGTGKSAVFSKLIGSFDEVVLLDSDLLWKAEYDQPENNYREFMELWLRMCKNISQSGRTVVLFGAGTGVPLNIEPCIESRYFSRIHHLALVCEDDVMVQRLGARKNWSKNDDRGFLTQQIEFNTWLKVTGKSTYGIEVVDTTSEPLDQTAQRVATWIRQKLNTASLGKQSRS